MMNQTCLMGGREECDSPLDDDATAEGIPVINKNSVASATATTMIERRLCAARGNFMLGVCTFMRLV